MLQTFYINRGATLPKLKMELIEDGINDYRKINNAVQNCTATFTMINEDTGLVKISNANAYVQLRESENCNDEYLICYDWKERDTRDVGNFKGTFNIEFGKIKSDDGIEYPEGLLIMPIREELRIVIR